MHIWITSIIGIGFVFSLLSIVTIVIICQFKIDKIMFFNTYLYTVSIGNFVFGIAIGIRGLPWFRPIHENYSTAALSF